MQVDSIYLSGSVLKFLCKPYLLLKQDTSNMKTRTETGVSRTEGRIFSRRMHLAL